MLLHSIFYRPPVRVAPNLVEFTCRVCGKRQMGRKNQKVCPGREGECRKAWQAGVSKKAKGKRKEKRKKEREKGKGS